MPQGKSNRSVLLIDDDDIDNFINENIVKASGFASKINVYNSALSGLEFLKNLEKNYDSMKGWIPDVIFLDLNMPLMNGFQFIKEFEKLSDRLKSRIKIFVLTSSHDPRDLKTSLANARVEKYLHKPLNEEDLKRIEKMN